MFVTRDRDDCAAAMAAQHWADAAAACRRTAETSGDPEIGLREAQALLYAGRDDDALAAATALFDTAADATARQIAGAIHERRGDHGEAIPLLRRALQDHVRLGNHDEAARSGHLLAGALVQSSLFGEALDVAREAVREADLAGTGAAHRPMRGSTRLALGKIYIELGDQTNARQALLDAQHELAGSPTDEAWVFLQLGLLQLAVGEFADSAHVLETALDLATRNHVDRVAIAARLNLAYARRELGDLRAADAALAGLDAETRDSATASLVAGLVAADRRDRARAEELLARAAASPPSDDYAIDIALQRGRLAERGGDTHSAERFYRQAIELVEKLRAKTSLELRPWILARQRAPYGALVALLAYFDRRDEAFAVAEALHARTWRDALVEHTGADARSRIASAGALDRRLATAAPFGAADLLAATRHREVLMFSETGSGTWRFHIVDGRIERLDRLPDWLPALVDRWRGTPNDRDLAHQLGAVLVPPSIGRAKPPADAQPLYIVANGALDGLAFAALRPDVRFLVEDRAIARVPDITALRCRPVRASAASSTFIGDSRGDLPNARDEALELARSLSGRAYVGNDATVERVRESRSAGLLHLSVHAEADRNGAWLVLAGGRKLATADILQDRIGPRIAVLAGCATAVSRDREGWDALTSAFLAAGTTTVIGTLQSVEDARTSTIIRRFYALGGELHPVDALAKAQREQLDGDVSAWSPFVAYGVVEGDCDRL